jgi:hypothetical protein
MFHFNVFIKVRPVDADARSDQPPVRLLLRRAGGKPRILAQRDAERASILEIHTQRSSGNNHVTCACS